MKKTLKLTKQEILASHEVGTYLDGLRDALGMTHKEILRAIKIIVDEPPIPYDSE
jgi:hypothetical protein